MPRLSKPRIEPVSMEEYEATLKGGAHGKRAAEVAAVNIARTWQRHPKLMQAHRALGIHLGGPDSDVPKRDRELGIIRMGVKRQCDYEFAQHRAFNMYDGTFTEEDIMRIVEGPDAPGWSDHDRALLRAVDEMHDDAFISDATWAELKKFYSDQQLMDYMVVVSRYWMVSTLLNSMGVQLEENKKDLGLPKK
jgi:alkylhydroperoxidase family enzyme